MNTVRVENGQLMLDNSAIGFYAPIARWSRPATRAATRSSSSATPDGTVGWVRVVGRIARKD